MAIGRVAKYRFKHRKIRNIMIDAVAFVLIAIIVVGAWYMYSNMSASAEQEATEELARSIANKIDNKYLGLVAPINALTKDKTLIDLYLQADEDALKQEAMAKAQTIPHILKLRFLLLGKYKLDTESNPPMGYASLDLLRKAKSSAQINAEVILKGTEQEHILIIKRVINPAMELIGFIHASLSTDLFKDIVSEVNPDIGYVEITQSTAGKTIILAKAGRAAFKKGNDATISSIKNTSWVLKLWPGNSPVTKIDETGSIPLLSVLAIIIFLLLVGFIFIKKRSSGEQTTVSQGSKSFLAHEGAIRAIEGVHSGLENPNLPKGDGKETQDRSDATSISQGVTGDDITRISTEPARQTETAAESDSKPEVENVPQTELSPGAQKAPASIDPVIFRTYDIRGVVDNSLNEEVVTLIGKALGTMAVEKGQTVLTVGRDGRTSGPKLVKALIDGLVSTGINIVDIGMVPTPVLYFSTYLLETGSGVMVTGSHNPPEYNGLKMMLGGNTLSGDDIQEIKQCIKNGEFVKGKGQVTTHEVNADYIRRISADIPVALGGALKIVVDCGNGAAGVLAPQLLNAIGQDVIEMYCEIDGTFPNHHPDPSQPENMQELIQRVKAESADIGFAFDGDGDRLGVVDAEGNIIWPDRQLMLLAKDVLSRNAGAPIIYDVKCSRYLKSVIEESGGKSLMWKTGHSLIKGKMKETEAPLAGEMSGHIFFKERWYGFDDALYTAARFVEIFTNAKRKPTEMFAELPGGVSTPELRLPTPEKEHGAFMIALIENLQDTAGGEVSDIDGVRLEFEHGWGLARASNTSPNIVMRFEGEDAVGLENVQNVFKQAILSIKADAQLPF